MYHHIINIMKRILTAFVALLYIVSPCSAQKADTYFPYPTAPDNLSTLSQRCNYIVYHFWDFCNFKSAFSSLPRMNAAVGDFLSFMPYASADTAHIAIDGLIDKVKKNPRHLLSLAKMAKGYLMSDTSTYISEELYLPFAKAVAGAKKVPSSEREVFAREARILENTMIGTRISDMKLTLPDGSQTMISANTAPMMLLVFTGPDCSDCSLCRIRLSADYALNRMIKDGRLKIINVYVGPDGEQWKKWASDAPADWVTGRNEDAASMFDLSVMPTITYLNRRMEVLSKDLTADDVIRSFQNHIMTH